MLKHRFNQIAAAAALALASHSAQSAEFIVALDPILANKPVVEIAKSLSNSLGMVTRVIRPVGSLPNTFLIQTDDKVVRTKGAAYVASALDSMPVIAWAQENTIYRSHSAVTPNDSLYGNSQADYLGSNKPGSILMDQAWGLSRGSYSTVVAVLDSGILANHPDLKGKTVPGYSFFRNSALDKGVGPGPDARDPGNYLTQDEIDTVPSCTGLSPTASDWHGTKVASALAASSNNGQGIAGTTWNAKIQPVRVTGPCGASLADVLDSVAWAGGLPVSGAPANPTPARVINMSFGSSNTTCPVALQSIIDQLVANKVVIVASAGNNNGRVTDPASCNGVIAVGSNTNEGLKSGFSNYGDKISIFAPGGKNDKSQAITMASNTGTQGPSGTFIYGPDTGTSFSAPLVAGVVANMLSINPGLSPAEIASLLRTTARPFALNGQLCAAVDSSNKSSADCACTEATCGSGILNAFGAMSAAQASTPVANPGAVRVVIGSSTTVDGNLSSVAQGRSIASFQWSVLSGSGSLSGANSANVTVSGSASNTPVVLRLKVTDSVGEVGQADTAVRFENASVSEPNNPGTGTGSGTTPTAPVASTGSGGGSGGGSTLWAAVAMLLLAGGLFKRANSQ